jgi:hypothetical protein
MGRGADYQRRIERSRASRPYYTQRDLPVLVISPLSSPDPVSSAGPVPSVIVDTLSPSCSVPVDETVGPTDSDSDIVIVIVMDPSPCSNVAHTSGSEPKEVASDGTPLESKQVVQSDKVGREEMFAVSADHVLPGPPVDAELQSETFLFVAYFGT